MHLNFAEGVYIDGVGSNRCHREAFGFVRLCENSLGALRRRSGRTDKYSISNETTPFVVSLVEP